MYGKTDRVPDTGTRLIQIPLDALLFQARGIGTEVGGPPDNQGERDRAGCVPKQFLDRSSGPVPWGLGSAVHLATEIAHSPLGMRRAVFPFQRLLYPSMPSPRLRPSLLASAVASTKAGGTTPGKAANTLARQFPLNVIGRPVMLVAGMNEFSAPLSCA